MVNYILFGAACCLVAAFGLMAGFITTWLWKNIIRKRLDERFRIYVK